MATHRWFDHGVRQRLLAAALTAATVACDRSSRTPADDTASLAGSPRGDSTSPVARNIGWNDADGPILLVATSAPTEAHVVLPFETVADSTRFPSGIDTVKLIGRDGRLWRGRVLGAAPHANGQCVAWPMATVRDSAGAAPPGWSVGFTNAAPVTAIALDSLEAFNRSDSSRYATEIARMASALKDDTVAQFRGLPFVVREMRRFHLVPNIEGVVADVARRLATEANPREERLFLIAERTAGGQWQPAYWTRASGAEDAVESGDALAIVRFPADRAAMIVALEEESSMRFALVERDGTGKWRLRWRSAETDC